MPDPTLYSEAKFLAALDAIKAHELRLVVFFGKERVETVKAALWMAANEAAVTAECGKELARMERERDPDPGSADVMTMMG